MKYMAHIINNKITNVSVWDGVSDWNPENYTVQIPTQEITNPDTGETKSKPIAGIGWTYLDGQFIDERPPLKEEPNLPKEETPQENEGES